MIRRKYFAPFERICAESGFACEFPLDAKGKRSKNAPWDIRVQGIKFELKTATEDVSGSFQFNHIRYHRAYDALLCVGVAPADGYDESDRLSGKKQTGYCQSYGDCQYGGS